MKSALMKFWRDEEGATAIEYGLIAALIAVVAMVAMSSVGGELNNIFTSIFNALESKSATAPTPAPSK